MERPIAILLLSTLFLAVLPQNLLLYAVEERKTMSRRLTGIAAEIYAPYQCYPGDTITTRAKFEALEDVRNASVTVFILGSKSEGYEPWTFSFKFMDLEDLSNGTVRNEAYDVAIPADLSAGLTYGKTVFQWSIYRSPTWEQLSHEAFFSVTYVKNRDFEDFQRTRTLMYTFLGSTAMLAIATLYLARKSRKT